MAIFIADPVNPAYIAHVNSSGYLEVAIESGGGGGTQYTDETAESAGAFTGTVAMGYNGTDVVGLRLDSSNNLYVNLDTAIPAGSALIGKIQLSDGTNVMGAMTNFGTTPTAVKALSANVSLFQGTAVIGSTNPIYVNLANTGQNMTPLLVALVPQANASGWSTYYNSALSDTAAEIKGSAGNLGGYAITNPNASTIEYVMFFNTATPTVGSTTPLWVIGVPGGGSAHIEITNGIAFSSVIYALATSSLSSATAPSTALILSALYI